MVVQLSTAVRNAMLDQLETTIGSTSLTLELRTGVPPANCAAADTGSVVSIVTLPADWLAAASGGSKAILGGPWQDTAADASGRISHFRLKQSTTCHIQGLVADAWQATRAYSIGDQVINGGNLYRATAAGTSAGAGGPAGTGTGITDGTVTWNFVQAGTEMTLQNCTVNSGQPISITAFTLTQGGA